MLKASALLLTIAMASFSSLVCSIRCFCSTHEGCEDGKYCDSEVCLVGIPNKETSVIRSCQTGQSMELTGRKRCWTGAGSWEIVCACQSHYCNTYHFFRTQMDSQDYPTHQSKELSRKFESLSRKIVVNREPDGGTGSDIKNGRYPNSRYIDDSTIDFVSAILDTHNNEYSQPDSGSKRGSSRREPVQAQSFHYLTVVLILVPLFVGAAAFCVVACNNYSSLW